MELVRFMLIGKASHRAEVNSMAHPDWSSMNRSAVGRSMLSDTMRGMVLGIGENSQFSCLRVVRRVLMRLTVLVLFSLSGRERRLTS